MTLAIAIVALALSMISLAFTVYQWQRSGPVLSVKVVEQRRIPRTGGKHVVIAEVMSIGRLPVTVRRVETEISYTELGKFNAWTMEENISRVRRVFEAKELSQRLPVRLEPSEVLEAEFELPGPLSGSTGRFTVRALAGGRWALVSERYNPPREDPSGGPSDLG